MKPIIILLSLLASLEPVTSEAIDLAVKLFGAICIIILLICIAYVIYQELKEK